MKIDALNGKEQYEYDPVGNLLAKIDANGHAQQYEYDRVNRLTKAMNAENHEAAIVYDENGNPVELTDRNGNTTALSYDALDRLALKTDALQGEWRYIYDAVGNLLTEIDANGHEDHYLYDALNRTLSITDAEGNATIIVYDPNGNKVKIIDGNGHAATLSYDALDRLVSRTNAEGETSAYNYDAEGNRTNLIEADGVITKYDYDKIYRLVAVIQNFQGEGDENADVNVDTNYSYDPNDNLVEILNPNEAATRFEYDPLNRQIQEIDAEGNIWAYQYDPAGNRTVRLDANGHETSYSYYPDDQVQKIQYYDGTSVAYSYDPNNNRSGIVDHIGTSSWIYDALNRVTAVDDALGRKLAYGYDPVGNRVSLTYPDGRIAKYGYYKNDWLQSLTDPEQGLIGYRRDGVGMTTQILNPNETFSGIQYDKVNRILQIANKGKKVNSAFKYTYNEVGHRTSIEATYAWRTKDAFTTNYQYDGLRRLVRSEDSEEVWNTYEYDRAGNRLSYATNDDGATNNPKDALSRAYSYNSINQVQSVVEEGKKPKTTVFEYDANGNRIKKQFPGPQGPQVQGTLYAYDPENRLAEALNYQSNKKGNIIDRDVSTMQYDGLGRRLVKIHDNKEGGGGAKRVEYNFDGLDPIADYNTWNPQYTNYYRGDGNRIALRQNFPTGTAGQRYWYHYDALGSVVGLTKQNGQGDHNYPYGDYGLIEPQTGNFTEPHNAYTYTGQAWDANIGVYEFYARAYDPEVGVWLQQDVYRGQINEPMSLHRSMYVKNNPINYADLYGFAWYNDAGDFWDATGGKALDKGGDVIEWTDEHVVEPVSDVINEGFGYGMAGLELGVDMVNPYTYFYVDCSSMDPRWGCIKGKNHDFSAQFKEDQQKWAGYDVADNAVDVCAAVLFEPYDWASTGYAWAHGDFSYWDLLGFLPVIPTGVSRRVDDVGDTIKAIRKLDDAGDVIKKTDDIWAMSNQFERGRIFEDIVAATDYKDYERTATFNKNYELFDFFNDNTAVSLKTTKNLAGTKYGYLEEIKKLGESGVLVGSTNSLTKADNIILDIRVPKGGIDSATRDELLKAGEQYGVTVKISEL